MKTQHRSLIVVATALVAAQPVSAGLFAKFHGKDGDFLTDESTNGRNLTEVFQGTGKVRYHPAGFAKFPGNEAPNRAWLQWTGGTGAGAFTISFWVRVPAWNQGGFQGLYTNVEPGSFDYQIDLNGDTIRALSDPGVNISGSSLGNAVDTWHHIVLRKGGGGNQSKLYVTPIGAGSVNLIGDDALNFGGLQAIRLGINRNQDSLAEMDLANVQIYDDATVDLDTLLAEGPDLNPVLEWDPADDDDGGAGDWDVTTTHWQTTTAETPNTTWAPNDGTVDAVFDGAGGTVTLTAPVSANTLTVLSPGHTFESATAADTLSVTTGISNYDLAIFSNDFAGAGAISKTGTGRLTLNGDGTAFTGSFTTNGGEIFVTSPNWSSTDFFTVDGLLRIDSATTVSVNSVSLDTGLRIDNGSTLDVVSGSFNQVGGGGWTSTENGDTGFLTSSSGALNVAYPDPVGGGIQMGVILSDFDGSTPLTVNVTGNSPTAFSQLQFLRENTYTGGTNLDDIRAVATETSSFGTGTVNVLDGGQAWLQMATVANDFTIAGNGWDELPEPFGAIRFSTGNDITGTVTVDAAGARIGGSGTNSGLFSGTLLGSGNLELNNAVNASINSTLTFTGDGSGYTGELQVSRGLLIHHGTLGGDLFIDDVGAVAGDGSVSGLFTLGATGGATIFADGGTGITTTDLALNGVTTVDFSRFPETTGPISLFNYTGILIDDGAPGDVTDNLAVANIGNFRGPVVFTDNAMNIEVELNRKALTFAGPDGAWDINTSFNWTDGVVSERFYNGDSASFDDTVDPGFAGTVNLTGLPVPSTINVNNNTVDYNFAGELGAEAGGLTKDGTGTLTLTAPDDNMPYAGAITINDGTVALAGDTRALRNSEGITVNANGTFRVAAANAGQDTLPPILLSGGTLETNDANVFLFPATSTLTLAAGTDNTLTGTGTLLTFTNPIEGDGNLIKDGTGTLNATSGDGVSLAHTGTTTLNDGSIVLGGDNTAASETWTVNGGRLALQDDSAAPIENLPATATVAMTGGELDASGNTETLDTLSMDSTSGVPVLTVDPATSALTADTLTLIGTDNRVRLPLGLTDPGPHPVVSYGSTLNGTAGTNLILDPDLYRSGTWNDNAGTLEVTLNPGAVNWTGATSVFWEVGGLDQNWDGATQFFYNLDTVTFGDVGAGTVTVSDLDGDPVVPGGMTFTNTVGNDYVIDGDGIGGIGGMAVNGGGSVTLLNSSTFTGSVDVTNGSTLALSSLQADAVSDLAPINVSGGSLLEIGDTNAIRRENPISGGGTGAAILIDASTLTHTDGNHSHMPDITLRNGSVWSATSAGSFNNENTFLRGVVTVDGTAPSTIGPFTFGIGLDGLRDFIVDDVTGDETADLIISGNLQNPNAGTGGLRKVGPGTISMETAHNYTGQTRITDGVVTVNGTSQLYATGAFFGNNDTTYVFVEGGVFETDRFNYGVSNALSELRNNYYSVLVDGGTLRFVGAGPANEGLRAYSIGAGGATLEVAAGGFYRKLAGTAPNQNIISNDTGGSLTLTGEGTGVIDDDLGSFGADWSTTVLTKSGTGTWFLNGANTYGGDTIVNEGLLGGTGSVSSNVTVNSAGGLAPGASVGTFSIIGDLDLSGAAAGSGVLDFELDAIAASDLVSVTGVTTIGTGLLGFSDFVFTNLGGLEDGTYTLLSSGSIVGTLDGADLSGNIGPATATLQITGGDLELVVSGASTPYESYETANNIPGAGPEVDSDGDGIPNGIEFVIGGISDPALNSNDRDKLPTTALDATYLTFTFRRTAESAASLPFAEYGSTLTGWDAAEHGTDGVIITETTDGFEAGVDQIDVQIPRALATGEKLFVRLRVDIP